MPVNPYKTSSGGGLSSLMSIVQAGQSASKVFGGSEGSSPSTASPSTPQTDQNFTQPEMGSQFKGQSPSLGGDAMSRSLESKQQDPGYLVHQGLEYLNDPSVYNSMPQDLYMNTANLLLQAKHFGQGGQQGAGGVNSYQSGSGQAGNLGAIASIVALA